MAEILEARDRREDFAVIFNCRPNQISLTKEDALFGNTIYHHGDLNLVRLKELPEGVKMPKHVEGYLNMDSIKELPERSTLPKYVGGYLNLRSLVEWPEGVAMPEYIGGDMYLNSIKKWPEGVVMPKHVGGSIYLNKKLKGHPSLASISETVNIRFWR